MGCWESGLGRIRWWCGGFVLAAVTGSDSIAQSVDHRHGAGATSGVRLTETRASSLSSCSGRVRYLVEFGQGDPPNSCARSWEGFGDWPDCCSRAAWPHTTGESKARSKSGRSPNVLGLRPGLLEPTVAGGSGVDARRVRTRHRGAASSGSRSIALPEWPCWRSTRTPRGFARLNARRSSG